MRKKQMIHLCIAVKKSHGSRCLLLFWVGGAVEPDSLCLWNVSSSWSGLCNTKFPSHQHLQFFTLTLLKKNSRFSLICEFNWNSALPEFFQHCMHELYSYGVYLCPQPSTLLVWCCFWWKGLGLVTLTLFRKTENIIDNLIRINRRQKTFTLQISIRFIKHRSIYNTHFVQIACVFPNHRAPSRTTTDAV